MKTDQSGLLEKIYLLSPAFLLTLASLLHTYAIASVVSSPEHVIQLLAILWVILLFLIWPAYIFTHDWRQVGFLLCIFVIGFYLTEKFFYIVFIFSGLVFSAWFFVFYLRKHHLRMIQVTFLSNVIVIMLLVLTGIQIVPAFLLVKWPAYWNKLSDTKKNLPVAAALPENKPDIYYIILDAYGRSDILQEYYQYDNSEFIESLTKKGFFVPSKSHSNYPMTTLSVPTTLNMDYAPNIVAGTEDSSFWWLMEPYIQESRVQLFLENAGYRSVSVVTDWDITNNTSADIYFQSRPIRLDGFEGSFLQTTALSMFTPLLEKIALLASYNSHRELILYNFEMLANIPKISGPKFVFAHITAPHPPFIFDRNGNQLIPAYNFGIVDGNSFPGTDAQYRAGYIGQLEFINREVEKTIDMILAQSQTPPIIILQADHGPRMLSDFQFPENVCPKEGFSNFAAYYLPGLKTNPIPDEITPVNTFRIIFNQYFSTDLPLLESVSYAPEDSIYIYRTKSIQSRLSDECIPQP